MNLMQRISKTIQSSSQRFLTPFDMFFVYVYVVLGLQADYSFQFIMYYYNKYVKPKETIQDEPNFFQEVLVD